LILRRSQGSILVALVWAAALALGACVLFFAYGWLEYRWLEKSVVEKMDQYYLDVSEPGREQYLLEADQVFEVPYLASRLSVSAVPTRIFDANDKLIGEYVSEKGLYVRSPRDIPAALKNALVATEDGTFYKHHGVNWRATARAFLVDLKHADIRQGGSTITQQLAKILFTTRHRTPARKVFELFCARKLEEKFTKDQILLLYLNFAYFGHGAFGVESASQFYFKKHASDLTLPEAAMLVGIIANPSAYSPIGNLELAKARHRTVLGRMAKLGYIRAADVDRISKDFWDSMEARLTNPEVSFWRMRVNEAPYFIEEVRRALEKDYSKERILKGGLRVYTTLDLDLQKAADAALKSGLAQENRLFFQLHPQEKAKMEGGLAAVRASDGAIAAMVGGSAFNFRNQLNRAMDIRRPIGSSIKPFLYAAALVSGKFKPDDKMTDAPATYRLGRGKTWSPRNYGDKYYGEVTLKTAFAKSLNSVAVRILREIGPKAVARLFSQASGIDEDNIPATLSLALGTADASPLEMASAYAVFPNAGVPVRPYFIRRVEDRDGTVLSQVTVSTATPAVLDPAVCRAMIDLMQAVLADGGTAYHAAQATAFNIPAAGKTGTTNNYRDAWFTGFTPDLSASVWVGHDDMRIPVGIDRTGGSVAAVIWMRFMEDAYAGRPAKRF